MTVRVPLALGVVAGVAVGCSACHEKCRHQDNWCEGETLATCVVMANTEPGDHDVVKRTDCADLGASCVPSASGNTAACILRNEPCDAGAATVCSGSFLRRCFAGFARLDVGSHSLYAEECESACMFSQSLLTSYCVEPDPTCVRAGTVICLPDSAGPGSSRPDFRLCVEPGWTALVDCGLEICGEPVDETDPCISVEEARARATGDAGQVQPAGED